MTIDILDVTDEELDALALIHQKLIRTAQKSKNELTHKLAAAKKELKYLLISNGVYSSTIYDDQCAALQRECNYQIAILKEQLIFNLSANDPTGDGDTGDSGGDESAGYVVDYSLSYLERYLIVRDYYLAIEDPDERLVLYANDAIAREYLSSYYQTLYNYLSTL